MMFDLRRYLNAKAERINQALSRALPDDGRRITSAMRHSLMAGGKRLRPVLCMAGAEAVGGDAESVVPIACALEMVHTYSLIHDDLPAMDNDSLRRGEPTCHVAFDEATAILAGDGLLTLAFESLAAMDCPDETHARRLLAVMHRLGRAAGYQGMIQGQMADMAGEGQVLSAEQLQAMHGKKTGQLIRAAVFAGAHWAGADRPRLEGLEEYAGRIGLAFQITDDILNVEGDPARLGKAVGTDQHRHKNTYPARLGLADSKRLAQAQIDQALAALTPFDAKAEPLRAIARYIIEREH